MPEFRINGLTQIEMSMEDYLNASDEMLERMLDVQADVVVPAQKRTASTMLQGEYYKGDIANSVAKDKVVSYKDGKRIDVKFKGTVVDEHHVRGERIAAIAYINEYGKTNQPARPFIAVANEECAADAIAAAERVLDQYIKKI